jgi:hypothetical protein
MGAVQMVFYSEGGHKCQPGLLSQRPSPPVGHHHTPCLCQHQYPQPHTRFRHAPLILQVCGSPDHGTNKFDTVVYRATRNNSCTILALVNFLSTFLSFIFDHSVYCAMSCGRIPVCWAAALQRCSAMHGSVPFQGLDVHAVPTPL